MKVSLRTRPLKEVRKDLLIPGVMYGKSVESTNIEVEDKAIKDALKTYGKSMTFQITLNRKKYNVYIKNVQTNILKPNEIIHFDLHALRDDETVTAQIPVIIVGKEELEKKRYYVNINIPFISCEYSPGHGIQTFEFNVSEMDLDDAVYVKDLDVSEHIKVHDDPEQAIFVIKESAMPEEEDTDEDASEDADADAVDTEDRSSEE